MNLPISPSKAFSQTGSRATTQTARSKHTFGTSKNKGVESKTKIDDPEELLAFLRWVVEELVEDSLDLEFEKLHHEETILWTTDHIKEYLQDVLSFAFVEGDAGGDLTIGRSVDEEDVDEATGSALLDELVHETLVDPSWAEDADDVIPCMPMDVWGTGCMPVQRVFQDCEEEEAKSPKSSEKCGIEGETCHDHSELQASGVEAQDQAEATAPPPQPSQPLPPPRPPQTLRPPQPLRPLRPLQPTATTEKKNDAAAAKKGDKNNHPNPRVDAATQDSGVNIQRMKQEAKRCPWEGISKPRPRRGRVRPLRGHGEGRGLGQAAACTQVTQPCTCQPVIFKRMPHTTQSAIRAHYLQNSAQCEACLEKTLIPEEDVDVGAGGVFLEKAKLDPDQLPARFVPCQFISRKTAAEDKPEEETKTQHQRQPKKRRPKKPPARISIIGSPMDDPADPLNPSRLLPSINVARGVVLKTEKVEMRGEEFAVTSKEIKPGNQEFFARFDIKNPKDLKPVLSDSTMSTTKYHSPKIRFHRVGHEKVALEFPRLKPDKTEINRNMSFQSDDFFPTSSSQLNLEMFND